MLKCSTVVLSRKDLLDQLGKKLEGKSVASTLKRIRDGKATKWESAKGLFSLGTHLAIEVEHGRSEYKPLVIEVYEQIGQLIFDREGERK